MASIAIDYPQFIYEVFYWPFSRTSGFWRQVAVSDLGCATSFRTQDPELLAFQVAARGDRPSPTVLDRFLADIWVGEEASPDVLQHIYEQLPNVVVLTATQAAASAVNQWAASHFGRHHLAGEGRRRPARSGRLHRHSYSTGSDLMLWHWGCQRSARAYGQRRRGRSPRGMGRWRKQLHLANFQIQRAVRQAACPDSVHSRAGICCDRAPGAGAIFGGSGGAVREFLPAWMGVHGHHQGHNYARPSGPWAAISGIFPAAVTGFLACNETAVFTSRTTGRANAHHAHTSS